MTDADLFLVGGSVRDSLLGIDSKDIDFSVVLRDVPLDTPAEEAFEMMLQMIISSGLHVFVVTPDKFTVRAAVPKGHSLAEFGSRTADFVLARKDGPYSDGRRPDWVKMGTLEDDLARRDFTVNAMAQAAGEFSGGELLAVPPGEGKIIDLFDGQKDLEAREIVFVGRAFERIQEDALRVMRALRFQVCKGLTMSFGTVNAIHNPLVPQLLAAISEERRREELALMFRTDTLASMQLIMQFPKELREAIFAGKVRLEPTLKA